AFAFRTDQEKAMKLGARRYFVKPVNLTELILAIEEELACQCR
ncbi:two-component system response regulator, partial [Fischerella thermalis WC542]